MEIRSSAPVLLGVSLIMKIATITLFLFSSEPPGWPVGVILELSDLIREYTNYSGDHVIQWWMEAQAEWRALRSARALDDSGAHSGVTRLNLIPAPR